MSNAFDDVELIGSLKNVNPGDNFFRSVPDHLKHDRELILASVQRDSSAFQYMSEDLVNDPEIVFLAMANFPKDKLDYMKKAIAINKDAFFNPPAELKDLLVDVAPVERYMILAKNAINTAPVEPSVPAVNDTFSL